MDYNKYLLIVDKQPVEEKISDYFLQLDIQILQENSITHISHSTPYLLAIIIDCSSLLEFELLEKLHGLYSIPIIVCHNTFDDELCIQALESGADDFLVKPINPRELHARICSIYRRVQVGQNKSEKKKEVFTAHHLRLYPNSRQVFDDTSEINLSIQEYDLLHTFLKQPNRILSRDFLLQITNQSGLKPFDRRIDVQVSRLRHKVEDNPSYPQLIKTIRNKGYIFTGSVLLTRE